MSRGDGDPMTSKGDNDPTGAFSVATLRDLIARTADDPAPAPPQAPPSPSSPAPSPAPPVPPALSPSPSRPELLSKGAPLLVFASEPPPAPRREVSHHEMPPPPPNPPTVEVAPEAPPVEVLVPVLPAPAMEVPRRPQATTVIVERRAASRRRPARSKLAAPSLWSRRWSWVERRVLALALLALVVASQPWWWNVGDVRSSPPPVKAQAASR